MRDQLELGFGQESGLLPGPAEQAGRLAEVDEVGVEEPVGERRAGRRRRCRGLERGDHTCGGVVDLFARRGQHAVGARAALVARIVRLQSVRARSRGAAATPPRWPRPPQRTRQRPPHQPERSPRLRRRTRRRCSPRRSCSQQPDTGAAARPTPPERQPPPSPPRTCIDRLKPRCRVGQLVSETRQPRRQPPKLDRITRDQIAWRGAVRQTTHPPTTFRLQPQSAVPASSRSRARRNTSGRNEK